MSVLPKALQDVIDALSLLPGVGQRSAERYAYYLLRADEAKSHRIARSVDTLHERVHSCPITFALIDADQKVSPLYDDPRRDKTIVAVVEDPFDIAAIERTGQFKGTYHVLGGMISPIDNIGPEKLHIKELINRIDEDKVSEVILATNASVEGESTALYISQQIGERDVQVTRLARGLPIGLDLEYADQITLSRALEGRQAI